MRLTTASRLDLWFRVAIERNSLYGWPKQRSPRRTNDQTHSNAYFSIMEMDPCWSCLVQARLNLLAFEPGEGTQHMVSLQERQADGGLSGQWTPGVQVTRSRREATSVPRPVQVASSKLVMETNRGCAGEAEESISPPTPTSAGHVRHVGPWARVHASRRTVVTCGRLDDAQPERLARNRTPAPAFECATAPLRPVGGCALLRHPQGSYGLAGDAAFALI